MYKVFVTFLFKISSCDIENEEYLEITNFVARTRETISPILHTIVFDVNKAYFVWPLYLLICMEGIAI